MAGWTPASLPRQLGQAPAVVPPAPGGSVLSGPGGTITGSMSPQPGIGVNPGGPMRSSMPAPISGSYDPTTHPVTKDPGSVTPAPTGLGNNQISNPGGPSNPAFYGR